MNEQLQPFIHAFFFVSATSQSLPCVRHGTELHPNALRNKLTMLITSKETAERVSFNNLCEVPVSILGSVLSPIAPNTVLFNKVESGSGKHHFVLPHHSERSVQLRYDTARVSNRPT